MREKYKHRIRRMLLCAAALFVAPAVIAQINSDDDGRRLIDEFLFDMTTLQGSFKQSQIDAHGAIVEVTEGTLEIQRPGQFRWSYTEPYEQSLVADGLNLWSYDVDLAQVTVKPQAAALSNTPALLLGGSSNAMEQFNYEGSYVETETTWARLSPKETDSGFLRVELGFTAGTLARMVFFDNLEQTTLVELSDVSVNAAIDPARFQFAPPEDVDVVGIPAVADTMVQ